MQLELAVHLALVGGWEHVVMEREASVVIASDRKVLIRAASAYALFGFLVGGIPVGVAASVEARTFGWYEGFQMLAVTLLVLIVGGSAIPWWWFKAGRTRYEVSEGMLRFWNGSNLLATFPCDQVFLVRGEGYISWKSILTNGFGVADFPRVTIRTTELHVGPPILLWRGDSHAAFDRLAVVVSDHVGERKRRATQQ